MHVDPRPLKADPAILDARPELLADVPASVLQSRSEVLRRLGVPEADATEPRKCPGALVVGTNVDRTGCPRNTAILVAILGLPRFGGAYLPQSSALDERESGAKQGHWSVRVVETFVTPEASSTKVSDYVMERTGKGWGLVKKEPWLWID